MCICHICLGMVLNNTTRSSKLMVLFHLNDLCMDYDTLVILILMSAMLSLRPLFHYGSRKVGHLGCGIWCLETRDVIKQYTASELLGLLYLNDTHKIWTLGPPYIAQHHAYSKAVSLKRRHETNTTGIISISGSGAFFPNEIRCFSDTLIQIFFF